MSLASQVTALATAIGVEVKSLHPIITTTDTASAPAPTGNGNRNEYYLTALDFATATFQAPSGTPANGNSLVIRIKSSVPRVLAWNAIYRAVGVTLPTATVANKTLYIGAKYNSTDSKWDVIAVAQEA